jgi:polyhydroxyalkanoate synthesis regulator phasin
MLLDDLRDTLEAAIGILSPARAQQLAKDMMEPGAAKEQVAKASADLLEWSQRNRDRLKEFVAREVQHQVKTVGLASQADLDALKKRVRDLERAAGMTASGRKKATSRKATAKKATARKPAAPKPVETAPTGTKPVEASGQV